MFTDLLMHDPGYTKFTGIFLAMSDNKTTLQATQSAAK